MIRTVVATIGQAGESSTIEMVGCQRTYCPFTLWGAHLEPGLTFCIYVPKPLTWDKSATRTIHSYSQIGHCMAKRSGAPAEHPQTGCMPACRRPMTD